MGYDVAYMDEFFVYMLQCNDGSYYIGVTNNYEARVAAHSLGEDPRCYTFSRRPVRLVHLEVFQSIIDAIAREKQLKRWSRVKKEALIHGDYEGLQQFSRCHGSTGSP